MRTFTYSALIAATFAIKITSNDDGTSGWYFKDGDCYDESGNKKIGGVTAAADCSAYGTADASGASTDGTSGAYCKDGTCYEASGNALPGGYEKDGIVYDESGNEKGKVADAAATEDKSTGKDDEDAKKDGKKKDKKGKKKNKAAGGNKKQKNDKKDKK